MLSQPCVLQQLTDMLKKRYLSSKLLKKNIIF